ncbi:hypothetical protein [Halegenticoccus soli]|uniref:hypothetical protein n=1 Tax=Halegenticoccus soli TaxID=1985678 RepID=UPI000C6D6055|nr:hypothetical protein [Halegenticoccus soli]
MRVSVAVAIPALTFGGAGLLAFGGLGGVAGVTVGIALGVLAYERGRHTPRSESEEDAERGDPSKG